jgi:hypothetical protein
MCLFRDVAECSLVETDSCSRCAIALMMETVSTYETPVNFCDTNGAPSPKTTIFILVAVRT